MAESEKPTTLGELLVALEKSDNLRSLARQCGMAPSDLRRNLKKWRKGLEDDSAQVAKTKPKAKSKSAKKTEVPEDLVGVTPAVDVDANEMSAQKILSVWTDGASRGNPGPASIGIMFAGEDGVPLCAHAETIGETTNNVAEYRAALQALQFAVDWQVDALRLFMDSELIVRQLNGQYRVKSQDLLPYYRQIVSLSQKLKRFQVSHIRRAENSHADALANLALDGRAADFGGE
jgi:ribonuclease HI